MAQPWIVKALPDESIASTRILPIGEECFVNKVKVLSDERFSWEVTTVPDRTTRMMPGLACATPRWIRSGQENRLRTWRNRSVASTSSPMVSLPAGPPLAPMALIRQLLAGWITLAPLPGRTLPVAIPPTTVLMMDLSKRHPVLRCHYRNLRSGCSRFSIDHLRRCR